MYKQKVPCMYTHTCKLMTGTSKILESLSELSGLRKHQNNPACSKSVRVLKMLKLDTVQKKKQKIKKKRKKKTKKQ